MANKTLRILCLHGHGSNSRIFEAQTAALRNELGPHIEWVFVEGTIPVPMAEELRGHFPEEENCFTYMNVNDPDSGAQALQNLENFAKVEGPFQIIGCNSAASSLAASLLIQKAREEPKEQPLFQGAIFFSPLMPMDNGVFKGAELSRNGAVDPSDRGIINVPTACIWGMNDSVHAPHAAALTELCNPALNIRVDHSQGSSIPGAADEKDLVMAARAIRHTIDRAISAQQ